MQTILDQAYQHNPIRETEVTIPKITFIRNQIFIYHFNKSGLSNRHETLSVFVLNEKHQPDAVNKCIFHLCSVSTCFGQNIAHHQEINKMYKSAYGVRPVIRNSMWYNYIYISPPSSGIISTVLRYVQLSLLLLFKSHKIIVITFILHTVTTCTN